MFEGVTKATIYFDNGLVLTVEPDYDADLTRVEFIEQEFVNNITNGLKNKSMIFIDQFRYRNVIDMSKVVRVEFK